MPFTLNMAVDFLLKKEFDEHREKQTRHPVMKQFDIDAIPLKHPEMGSWRANAHGLQYEHNGCLFYGAIDDIWVTPHDGQYHVVDYKATGAKQVSIYASYRRQMEIYQWLGTKMGLPMSNLGYFLSAQADKSVTFTEHDPDIEKDTKCCSALEFKMTIIPLEGKTEWIEPKLEKLFKVLALAEPPSPGDDCDCCKYVSNISAALDGKSNTVSK